MKYRALISATALVSTSFTPITFMTASAQAAVPTMAEMQAVCDTNYDTDGSGTDYQVILTVGTTDTGTPEVDENQAPQNTNAHPDLTAVPTPVGYPSFTGSVGRIGQSPNLFSAIEYTNAAFPELVDVQHFYHRIDTYNFSCQLQRWDVTGNHEEEVPAEGHYYVDPEAPGNSFAHLQECNAYNNAHDNHEADQGFWGDSPHGNCLFDGTGGSTHTVDDYGWVNDGAAAPESLTNEVTSGAGLGWQTDETDQPTGNTISVPGHYPAGSVVVCNSPSSGGTKGAPGSWKPQNGYGGANCNTTYFKAAGWLAGVEDRFHALPTLPL